MMGHLAGFAPGNGDWSWIAGLALVVVVVVGLLYLIGWIADRAGWSDDERPEWDDPDLGPLGVLRMRYAYGEISHDEYLAAKETLESTNHRVDAVSQT